MMHEHKFNATIIGPGRCACGAWAHYNRTTKTWSEITHPPTLKGLVTRLRRFQDPNEPVPTRTSDVVNAATDERLYEREGGRPRSLTTIYKDE